MQGTCQESGVDGGGAAVDGCGVEVLGAKSARGLAPKEGAMHPELQGAPAKASGGVRPTRSY